ncbi:MAG: V-type ATP synthase subunit F [Clostridia bacterium]|nr:V-type ATP synthase subunit F [Clostridia bacterium]
MRMFLISDNIDTRTGMRLAGVEGTVVHQIDEVKEALEKAISDQTIGIILITEKLVDLIPERIAELKISISRPLIVEIPDRHGSHKGGDYITKYIREAIGLKI